MNRTREARKRKALRRRSGDNRKGEKRTGWVRLKTVTVLIGTALLTLVGYLSAGDKLSDLSREWASLVRESAIATALMIPAVRRAIAHQFVETNFGDIACAGPAAQFDLEKAGWENDLVVTIGPKSYDPDCSLNTRPSLAVLKNAGWSWHAVDLLEAEISPSRFAVRQGYIFLSLTGSDFPSFVIFALGGNDIEIVHRDYGELPEDLAGMFRYEDKYAFLISGRDHEVVISFDELTRKHDLRKVSRDRSDLSRLHVVGSSPGGWTESYTYDGEIIDREKGKFQTYFGELDLVFVPSHCDTKGLAKAPAFPGYYRAKANAEEIRICCPLDVEEYGWCDPQTDQPTGLEYLAIDIN